MVVVYLTIQRFSLNLGYSEIKSMLICETERLVIRQLTLTDTAFVLDLLNTPTWIQYIGDRGIKTLDEARNYLLNGPLNSYKRYGFGLNLVALKDGEVPIGMTGLIKRDGLDHPDIGFALHPDYAGNGYAYESASAVMKHAKEDLRVPVIIAITTEDNLRSVALLQKIGLIYEKRVTLPGNPKEYMLFSA
jgi:[ribosomal protein S5]-alanine N-acetyltransferase